MNTETLDEQKHRVSQQQLADKVLQKQVFIATLIVIVIAYLYYGSNYTWRIF